MTPSSKVAMAASSALLISFFLISLSGLASSQRDFSCPQDTGLFRHDDYCDYYWECTGGSSVLRPCPNGLAFSGRSGRGLLQHCDYPHRASCPDDDGRVMGQTPAGGQDARCPWSYGLFTHKTSCTRYWQCWNGTASVQFCPFSLLYNEEIHACDWPDNVPECQQHPLCKGIPNGRLPISGSCVRYWQCMGGYPQLHRCAAGLAFNPESLHCDWDVNVPGCAPQVEATPDKEE